MKEVTTMAEDKKDTRVNEPGRTQDKASTDREERGKTPDPIVPPKLPPKKN